MSVPAFEVGDSNVSVVTKLQQLTAEVQALIDGYALAALSTYGPPDGATYSADDIVRDVIGALFRYSGTVWTQLTWGQDADHPVAGEFSQGVEWTGYLYWNTAEMVFYQWTGAAWDALTSADTWRLPVLDDALTAPPGTPSTGDRYIVGPAATGAWSGHDGEVAEYGTLGWSFETPAEGWAVWEKTSNVLLVYSGTAWVDIIATAIGTVSWTLDGDTGTPQAVSNGQTATVAGDDIGVKTVVGATRSLTVKRTFTAELGPPSGGSYAIGDVSEDVAGGVFHAVDDGYGGVAWVQKVAGTLAAAPVDGDFNSGSIFAGYRWRDSTDGAAWCHQVIAAADYWLSAERYLVPALTGEVTAYTGSPARLTASPAAGLMSAALPSSVDVWVVETRVLVYSDAGTIDVSNLWTCDFTGHDLSVITTADVASAGAHSILDLTPAGDARLITGTRRLRLAWTETGAPPGINPYGWELWVRWVRQ